MRGNTREASVNSLTGLAFKDILPHVKTSSGSIQVISKAYFLAKKKDHQIQTLDSRYTSKFNHLTQVKNPYESPTLQNFSETLANFAFLYKKLKSL